MTRAISHHNRTREQFEHALADAVHASGLTPRTLVVRAGAEVYPLLLVSAEDGPHMTLPNVGWVALALDTSLDPWSASVTAKEPS